MMYNNSSNRFFCSRGIRKKIFLCVLCTTLFATILITLGQAQTNDRYTRNAIVVEVEGNTISAEDTTGNVWCYDVEGDTVPQVSTEVVLTMLAMGTDTIYDDQVAGVCEN